MNSTQIETLCAHPCLSTLAKVLSPDVLKIESNGCPTWSEEVIDQFRLYIDMIAKWNDSSGLVSAQDLAHLAERHILDALSLASHVAEPGKTRNHLFDIGSGAGFPAIPLKLAIPKLEVTLVERSTRKAAFIEMVILALGLKDVRILHGEFPVVTPAETPQWVTARAVEKPERLSKGLRGYLSGDTVFLCQFRNPETIIGPMFHVEHIEDEWTRQGWRRGSLSLVKRKA
jgi:16S rRNA (guanine(527)-N(7))-methyltransferase RsmG